MIYFPNAKINLGLSVLEKRPDGMHNIETCLIPISIHDVMEIQPSSSFSLVQLGLPLDCNAKDNLISKAWDLLLSIKKDIKPVRVLLYKSIPVGSGLGGGSSDAAFFLKAMNSIQSLGLTTTELEDLAVKVGSDCPFFIRNETAIATGIGNILRPVNNPIQNLYLTVVFPNLKILTTDAYGSVNSRISSDLSLAIVGNKLNWRNSLKNVFEEIAIEYFPEIQIIKNALYESGAIYVSLTGSGSALYALSTKPIAPNIFSNEYKVWSNVLVL